MQQKNLGQNDVITVIPGRDIWLAYVPTDTSYGSFVGNLRIPPRPFKASKPTIDFYSELLTGLDETMEVVVEDMVYSITGTSFDLNEVIPAEGFLTLEARIQSDGFTRFASEAQLVIIPARPQVPFVTLSHLVSDKGAFYINGRRATSFNGIEYKTDNGFWQPVEDNTIVGVGGTREIKVRLAATNQNFKSVETGNLNFELDAQLVDLIVVDGIHDSRLVIGGIQYFTESNIKIFSRWGNLIYEVDNYQNEFDFAGYPSGTYYYLVTYMQNGERKQYKNFVEVIRR